jgi:L-threonylcarbamoyladenylate synthase
MTPQAQEAAREALAGGGIVAYPTEAVFGLGCDPANPEALARLLALKGRDTAKGLILIAHAQAALEPWLAPLDNDMRARVDPTWPGPVTWLLPAASGVATALRGEHDTLAVRVTDHPVAAALCRAWGGPVVSTSANRAGGEPARSADEVRALFGDQLDLIIEGEVGGRDRPTTIRDGRTGQTLRA